MQQNVTFQFCAWTLFKLASKVIFMICDPQLNFMLALPWNSHCWSGLHPLLLSELQKEMAALTPKELVNLLNIIEEVLCVAQFFWGYLLRK